MINYNIIPQQGIRSKGARGWGGACPQKLFDNVPFFGKLSKCAFFENTKSEKVNIQ